jgi:CHASE3 domain sensor protein
MFHIDELIKAINGVIDIMPDKHVLHNGKYRILVTQDKFKSARDEGTTPASRMVRRDISQPMHTQNPIPSQQNQRSNQSRMTDSLAEKIRGCH